jgi:hypothetical protein
MKGSRKFSVPSNGDADLLVFMPIDYAWMVGSGIVNPSDASWQSFSEGYQATDARLSARDRALSLTEARRAA